MTDRFVGTRDICEMLGISRTKLFRLKRVGRLPVRPVQTPWTAKDLWRLSDVQAFLAQAKPK